MKLKVDDAGGGRGLLIAKFKDLYGVECSIQTSSLATEDALWLGQHHCGKCDAPTRMHLTRDMAAVLAVALKHFANTGELVSMVLATEEQSK